MSAEGEPIRPDRVTWRERVPALLLGAVFVCGLAGATLWLPSGADAPLWAFALQFGCAAFATICAVTVAERPALLGVYLQLAIWTAFGGAFGAGAWLFAAAFGWRAKVSTRLLAAAVDADQDGADIARLERLHHALMDGRLRIEGASETLSMRDILVSGAQPEKFRALSVIARGYDQRFAPALRVALQDSDAAVRVLATSVLSSLQNEFSARLAAKREIAEDAADPETWLELGEAHAVFARSGLLRAESRRREFEKAQDCMAKAVDAAPKEETPRLSLGQLLIEMGEYQQAVAVLGARPRDLRHGARVARALSEAQTRLLTEEADEPETAPVHELSGQV